MNELLRIAEQQVKDWDAGLEFHLDVYHGHKGWTAQLCDADGQAWAEENASTVLEAVQRCLEEFAIREF